MQVLRHPNVILFYGAFIKFPNFCIILEFCQRSSLLNILHDRIYKISWEFTTFIFVRFFANI